jgi:hypothetical protein
MPSNLNTMSDNILDKITAVKHLEVAAAEKRKSLEAVRANAELTS